MPDYEKMYFAMFNRISDALTELERQDYTAAEMLLKQAQLDGEKMYIDQAAGRR